MQRLYVHMEDADAPEFTKLFKVDPKSTTIAQVLTEFVIVYNSLHPSNPISLDQATCKDTNSKLIANWGLTVGSTLDNQADLFIRCAKGTGCPPPPSASSSATRAQLSQLRPATCVQLSTGPAPPQPPASSSVPVQPLNPVPDSSEGPSGHELQLMAVIEPYMQQALDLAVASNFKRAGEIYDQLLEIAPRRPTLLRRAALMWSEQVQLPGRAEPYARAMVAQQPTDSHALQLMGDVLLQMGQVEPALGWYDKALLAARNAHEGAEREADLQVCMARGLYASEDAPQLAELAAKLVMDVLSERGTHWEALHLYARIALDRGMASDALRVALRLLVARTTHKGVRRLVTQCIQAPQGLDALYAELEANSVGGNGAKNASAYAFLASCIKDCGAVPQAIDLLRRAADCEKNNNSYTLNLAHALELEQCLSKALQVAAAAFREAAVLDSTSHLGVGVDMQACAELLLALPELHPPVISTAWRAAEPWPGAQERMDEQEAAQQVHYNSPQLDLLALGFTAVKILYVGGAIAAAARLVQLLAPAHKASNQPLHTTLIRNEAAYFGCVQQLMHQHPPPSHSQNSAPLYLVGDSHTLTGAWREVHLRGESRLLHPVLVTGCKVWHLRPDSTFYPKHQFQVSMEALPHGTQVVMLLGEIDCREGLLVAVQKCKYENVAAGVAGTVDIYVALLLQLIQQRGLEIFVHPIPPVLNETRTMVSLFNSTLKSKVQAAAGTLAAQGRLHFLDFAHALLSADESKLAPGLELDGTHLSPAYLSHLDLALQQVQ